MYSLPLPYGMTWDDAAGQVLILNGHVEQYADMETGYVGLRFELHNAYGR